MTLTEPKRFLTNSLHTVQGLSCAFVICHSSSVLSDCPSVLDVEPNDPEIQRFTDRMKSEQARSRGQALNMNALLHFCIDDKYRLIGFTGCSFPGGNQIQMPRFLPNSASFPVALENDPRKEHAVMRSPGEGAITESNHGESRRCLGLEV